MKIITGKNQLRIYKRKKPCTIVCDSMREMLNLYAAAKSIGREAKTHHLRSKNIYKVILLNEQDTVNFKVD